jgi:hypothetical protein
MTARASCPECGAAAAPGRGSCGSCGFPILEEPRRGGPRPSPRALGGAAAAAVGALAVTLAVITLLPGDGSGGAPDPVPARAAEWQLERSLFSLRDDDSASVNCPRQIESASATRCLARYPSGSVRRIFVRVTPVGTLELITP